MFASSSLTRFVTGPFPHASRQLAAGFGRPIRIAIGSMAVAWVTTLSPLRPVTAQEPADLPALMRSVREVDRFGEGHREASEAVAALSRLPSSRIPQVLSMMGEVSPLSANWFRAAVEASADRDPQGVPVEELKRFLDDRTQGDAARLLAFDLIVDRQPEFRETVPNFRDDPCLPLRFMAIERGMKEAAELVKSGKNEEGSSAYEGLLQAARNPDQINAIADALEKLGSPVDLTAHYGFITRWHLIGPFDNREKIGFAAVYAPEKSIDLAASLDGKEGVVSWIDHASSLPLGVVDLNVAIGKHMGAVAYAVTTVEVDEPTTLDIRLGTPNGNQVFVNGQQVISNHVYHAGNAIDQHRATVTLNPGKNTILLKICQNEQTDSWAQDWNFQLRLCDASGKAIRLPE